MKMGKKMTEKEPHILYFDFLRIFATFCVIVLHICAQNWYLADITSYEWQVLNFYDSIVRWSVPVFVMISGALFLSGDYSIEKICKKNILRIITSFVFWSTLYAAVSIIQKGSDWHEGIVLAIKGHYHLWFLYMIIGLYLLVPLVKKFIESRELMRYFLILSLIFTFIIPQLALLLSLWREDIGAIVNTVVVEIDFSFTLGYISYFIFGYYLSREELSPKSRKLIYAGSLLGFLGTILLTLWISLQKNQPIELFYDRFTLNVMLESIGLFVLFRYKFSDMIMNVKAEKIIIMLSKYSFGAYLVHVMVMEQLDKTWGFDILSSHPLVAIPLLSMIIFIISLAISMVFNQIPILKKYIV